MTNAPTGSSRTLVPLTLAGAAGFWLANLVMSLTPLAADYRAAVSISCVPMLIEALVGGLVIAGCVSIGLMIVQRRGSSRSPIRVSMLLSAIALLVVTAAIVIPSHLAMSPQGWRYGFVATLINAVRIAALGLAIGYAAGRAPRVKGNGRPGLHSAARTSEGSDAP